MAKDKRLTQSPRQIRSSTEDPDKYGKGAVQIGQRAIRKDGGPENADAWANQGKGVSSQKDV